MYYEFYYIKLNNYCKKFELNNLYCVVLFLVKLFGCDD